MNVLGREGYSALVKSPEGTTWGFDVSKEHGTAFTSKLANMLLDRANEEYKKGCPKGYYKEEYNPSVTFTKIKVDMTDYYESETFDGTKTTLPAGTRKIGTYDREKNVLRIWEDGVPIYENNNGVICQDPVALADSLM